MVFDNPEDESSHSVDVDSDSKFCSVCGTSTTVTSEEVKYCGNCGRKLESESNTWNRFGSGSGDRNPDGDIGI